MTDTDYDDIAIVGMALRAPGAADIGMFWQNLGKGIESVSVFGDDQLRAAGIPAKYLRDPNYVKAAPIIDDVESFDADFFGISPREAEILDPQHRVFLEVCATAFQDAGYDPGGFEGRAGVYAGAKENFYLKDNLQRNATVMRVAGDLAVHIANNTDYLATGVAYRFNLRGPAVNVVTACSTSLVATHLAVRALRGGECDLAVAGGVEIILPVVHGYLYNEGGILAPDAHVRPFDANARGTVFGSGAGAVVLKRLRDAVADRDSVHAVIVGSAVNNDGADKGAFSAPSRAGQQGVIEDALRDAGVDPASIGYVEAHGTGTLVGDPIEVAALTSAYGRGEDRSEACPIGSVKGNVGHLGAAAGVCGLIKAACSVRLGEIPPTINFAEPNPRIDFAQGPFYVGTSLAPWPAGSSPRRAGVSSFGIGGTNAHVVIEQPPAPRPVSPSPRKYQLITLSAQAPAALDAAGEQLAGHLAAEPDGLADMAYTLSVGRPALPVRRVLIAGDARTAAAQLAGEEGRPLFTHTVAARSSRSAAFLFPGQGAQYPQMARGLYESEPAFAAEIDRCAKVLASEGVADLRALLYQDLPDEEASARLRDTTVAQPALFAVEYALASLLRGWGIEPAVMAGHSVGEYVAAALAGVFSPEDGLRLVARRGALMGSLPAGSMLAIGLPERLLVPMLPPDIDLAAVNAPGQCVVSGESVAIRQFQEELALQGVSAQPLHTSHAFHSRLMDPILAEFTEVVASVPLSAPAIPYAGNLTGKLITPDEATDPGYWAAQLRGCVRFADALRLLTASGRHVFLEVGPGRALSSLVTAQGRAGGGQDPPPSALATMRHSREERDDAEVLAESVARAWACGAPVDWRRFWAGEPRRRSHLPAYPYQRKRFWAEPDQESGTGEDGAASDQGGPLYLPAWRETAMPAADPVLLAEENTVWLVFAPRGWSAMREVLRLLRAEGRTVVVAEPGQAYARARPGRYTLRPGEAGDYARLWRDLARLQPARVRVVHAWSAGRGPARRSEEEQAWHWLGYGFFSVLALLQEAARVAGGTPVDTCVLTTDMQDVTGDGAVEPGKAGVLGMVKLAAKEFTAMTCRSIDVGRAGPAAGTAAQIFAEITSGSREEQVAYRGRKRWTWSYCAAAEPPGERLAAPLRERGRYLITGGLGGLGLLLAQELGRTLQARLVLVGRTALPDRAEWPAIIAGTAPDDPVARRIRAIQAVEDAGGDVLALAGDVTDEAAMREVKAAAERAYGGIDGVFHLAAVAGGGMLETRSREAAEAVFAPKVTGVYVLEKVFEPELLVLYSSIAVVHGDFGLGDYAGANAVLDAFAQSRWPRGGKVISINFPPWLEAGMAYEIQGPALLRQVTGDTAPVPAAHPLLASRRGSPEQAVVYDVAMAADFWVLAEHKLAERPTMPGTAVLELVRAACAEVTGSGAAEVRGLHLLRPLAAEDDVQVRAELRPDSEGGFLVTITGLAPGGRSREYARGQVRPLGTREPAPRHDLAALRQACQQDTTPRFRQRVDALEFGRRWDNITARRSADSGDTDLVTIELAEEFAADLGQFLLHPAILDSAGAMGMRLPAGGRYLPFSYDRAVARRPLPVRCHAIIRYPGGPPTGAADIIRADVTVVDDTGTELAAIEGYTLVRYDEARAAETAPGQAGSDANGAAAGTGGPVAGQGQEAGRALGAITAAEGHDALRAALGMQRGPQVIFCPEGIAERGRRVGRVTRQSLLSQPSPAATTAGTRDLETPYAEPATRTEVALARLWQEALWLDKVGADDDFFQLGGNSLIAVQLVAGISKTFGTELPVAALFDLRTVRRVAAAIEESLVERVSALTEEEAAAELASLDAAGEDGQEAAAAADGH
ncbi:MAG: SDR family oxidoreductase [Actinobacteria bacterium]|nr:SDR family oxidoreductase [Actinomycetota bacterium]